MSYTASYTLSCNGLQTSRQKVEWRNLGLLVDPVEGGALPGDELLRLEPEGNLLLGVLDAVGTVADVAADVDSEVTTDGAGSGGKRVGGTEDGTAGLDDITALPDHGADGAAEHVGNKTLEEGLVGEVGVVLLKLGLRRRDQLHGNELEATVLEARDDGADESALDTIRLDGNEGLLVGHFERLIRDDGDTEEELR